MTRSKRLHLPTVTPPQRRGRSTGSLTLPLFLGATRKPRIRSTRSEWVPFFSRSRTLQTTFSLELVK